MTARGDDRSPMEQLSLATSLAPSLATPLSPLVLHDHSRPERLRRHAVILRVTELALRHHGAAVAEVVAVDAELPAARAISDTCVERREPAQGRRVAHVHEPVARVIHAGTGDESFLGRERHARGPEPARGHLDPIAPK